MSFNRPASAILAVTFTLVTIPRFTVASEKTSVVAAVHQFFDNLHDQTFGMASQVCDSPVSIMDEFPPHHWYGPNACADWWQAFKAYDAKSGITPGDAKLGPAWTVDVSGDTAYFVCPATYVYEQHGKIIHELHAVFTAALRKTDTGWRIRSWTWTKH